MHATISTPVSPRSASSAQRPTSTRPAPRSAAPPKSTPACATPGWGWPPPATSPSPRCATPTTPAPPCTAKPAARSWPTMICGHRVASPGGYIALYPTSPVSLALAHVVALTAAGDYDNAEKALDDIEITREPAHEAIHKFVGATLHFVTHRWPDVLEWASRPTTPAGIGHRRRHHLACRHRPHRIGPIRHRPHRPRTPHRRPRPRNHRRRRRRLPRTVPPRPTRRSRRPHPVPHRHRRGPCARPLQTALNDPSYGPVVTTAEAIAARY